MSRLRIRGAWCGAGEAGKTAESVEDFVARQAEIGINALFMNVKDGNGYVSWPCSFKPELTASGYESFDLPAEMLRACEKHGVEFHAWFMDFFDGEVGEAFKQHPEWAMRNKAGGATNMEILRGQRFRNTWMCPAQRPGYTDQWLVPLYDECARRYDVTSVHHDYIRYPGDMAPDQYCFCDYCLENIPKFCGFVSSAYSEEPFYHELYDRSYLEAHWEPSPRVLPANWATLDRESKARFLLEGSFFQGGRYDLDYFFYSYRVFWITEFARLCAEAVRKANTKVEISGALFKNPIHSGRFIGQDWRQHAPYCDTVVPMDYRDHFPGTFEQYLTLLKEAIEAQKVWARDFKHLYIGAAINFLYKEEEGSGSYPESKVVDVIDAVESTGVEGIVFFCVDQIERYGMRDVIKRKWS